MEYNYLTDDNWLAQEELVSTVETITPEVASRWLDLRAVYQRYLSKHHVGYLSRELSEGRFKANGATVCFDTNGNLSDGQHRITSCVQSGVPFKTVVVRGIEAAAFDTIDSGKPRSAKDALERNNVSNAAKVASTIKVLARFDEIEMRFTGYSGKVPTGIVTQFYELEAPKLTTSIYWGMAGQRAGLSGNAALSAFYFVISKIDEARAEDFMQQLIVGAIGDEQSPVLHARNALFRIRDANGKTDDILFKFPVLSHGWNLFITNERRKNFVAPAPENARVKGLKPVAGWIRRGLL